VNGDAAAEVDLPDAECCRRRAGSRLAKFCQDVEDCRMSTMNVSLPESMRRYIDKQVREGGYGTSSEYVRELIRKDQAHQRLREALMEGIASGPAIEVNEEYWTAKLKRAARGPLKK
jgi:antitoxin ParD1/3/4